MSRRGNRPLSKSSTVAFAFLFGAMFVGMGGLMLRDGIGTRSLWADLDSRGERTTGTVVDHVDYNGKKMYVVVDYAGTHSQMQVSPRDYFNLPNGTPVQVSFNKSDPQEAKLVNYPSPQAPNGLIAGGIGMMIAGIALTTGVLIWARRSPIEDL